MFDVERRDRTITYAWDAIRDLLAQVCRCRQRSHIRTRIRRIVDRLAVRVVRSERQSARDSATYVDIARMPDAVSGRIEKAEQVIEFACFIKKLYLYDNKQPASLFNGEAGCFVKYKTVFKAHY